MDASKGQGGLKKGFYKKGQSSIRDWGGLGATQFEWRRRVKVRRYAGIAMKGLHCTGCRKGGLLGEKKIEWGAAREMAHQITSRTTARR